MEFRKKKTNLKSSILCWNEKRETMTYLVNFAEERSFVFAFLRPPLNPVIEFNNWDLPVEGAGIEADIGGGGGGIPAAGGGGGATGAGGGATDEVLEIVLFEDGGGGIVGIVEFVVVVVDVVVDVGAGIDVVAVVVSDLFFFLFDCFKK